MRIACFQHGNRIDLITFRNSFVLKPCLHFIPADKPDGLPDGTVREKRSAKNLPTAGRFWAKIIQTIQETSGDSSVDPASGISL